MAGFQFDPKFRPLLLPGQTAKLFTANDQVNVEILAVQALPSYIHDFGQLSGGGSSLAQDVTQLDMDDGQFAQYRFLILNDYEVEFTHPSSTDRYWRTSTQNFRAVPFTLGDKESDDIAAWRWAASEFFVYQQETPRFDLYSPAQVAEAYMEFMGYKFFFKKIDSEGVTKLWVNSRPTS
jgi:hypothetical protein